jgi:hypothetical protein
LEVNEQNDGKTPLGLINDHINKLRQSEVLDSVVARYKKVQDALLSAA